MEDHCKQTDKPRLCYFRVTTLQAVLATYIPVTAFSIKLIYFQKLHNILHLTTLIFLLLSAQ